MERNDREKPAPKPDPAAEEELSDKAVEPHQPTYPPAGGVGETVEPEDERPKKERAKSEHHTVEHHTVEHPEDGTAMERVNNALHRARPRAARER